LQIVEFYYQPLLLEKSMTANPNVPNLFKKSGSLERWSAMKGIAL
jgi:hypothetical protein